MPDAAAVSLETPPDGAYARVLTAAAETLAQKRGFATRENVRFQLTVDEFFTYLARIADTDHPIRTVLASRRHQLRAAFSFAATTLSLGALNATAVTTVDGDGEPSRDMGLLLAGRVADRFQIVHQGRNDFLLEAEVDRAYPPAAPCARPVALRPPYRAEPCADPGLLSHAAALAAAGTPRWHCPDSLLAPGRFADMVAEGQESGVVAVDAAGRAAGLLCWTQCGPRSLHFSGPFVFVPPADAGQVARLLTDRFLETVAREDWDIVFSQHATPDTPPGYFESLGHLVLRRPDDGTRRSQEVLYRHLREDRATAVWCHPALEAFLRRAYDDLAMCRDILPAEPPESRERRQSLLSTTLDKGKDLAELRALLDGADMPENIAAHVAGLAAKGIGNILFYLDIANAWEAALCGDLLRTGFVPRLVLPGTGRGDVVVLQHVQTD